LERGELEEIGGLSGSVKTQSGRPSKTAGRVWKRKARKCWNSPDS